VTTGKVDFPMAGSVYAHACSSSSNSSIVRLPTLSSKATVRASVLQCLVDDLRLDHNDLHGDDRMAAVFALLWDGAEALDDAERETLLRLGVPPELVSYDKTGVDK
jgi:hypothetical protein